MKFQVLQERLSKALSITSRFVQSRAQLPVLSNICFKAEKGRLTLLATNLEMSLSVVCGAKIESEGSITIPAKVIVDLIHNVVGEIVEFEIEKEQVKISSGNFSSTLTAMNASDFPAIPTTMGKSAITINSKEFLSSLSKILFAVSVDETRPVLTGVLFIFEDSKLTLVSTDGFRLSKKTLPIKSDITDKFILPKNILAEITRLMSEEETFSLSFNKEESQVVFGIGEYTASSRIIDGTFPDFEKILPKTSVYNLNLDKTEFHKAVKLASIFARDAANVVKFKLVEDGIEVLSESAQSGTQKNLVSAKIKTDEKITGEVTIAFNFKFVEDFLANTSSDDLDVRIIDGASPGVFLDPTDNEFLHLIMPVRLES